MEIKRQSIITSTFPNVPRSEVGIRLTMFNSKLGSLCEDYKLQEFDNLINCLKIYSDSLHKEKLENDK